MVGVEVAKMQGVAMSGTGTVEHRAVVVNTSCSIYNLVAAVAVNIANRKGMSTFTVDAFAGSFRLMQPALRKVLSVEVPCTEIRCRIIAAAHHQARLLSVEISHTRQIALRAVAVRVAPL